MRRAVVFTLLAILAFVMCYPVLFILTGSLMSGDELSSRLSELLFYKGGGYVDWALFPRKVSPESFRELFLFQPGFFRLFWNTVLITGGVLLGQLLLAAPAAWGFAQYKFRGRGLLFTLYIILMMLPFQVLMLPEYIHLGAMGLLNSLPAVILPGVFSTFPVFIEYNFFRGIPSSVVEAARLDGAGEPDIFLRIGLPAGRAGIAAAMMLQFLEYWSIIEPPMAFLDSPAKWPLSLFIPSISVDNAGIAFVASLIAMFPAILIFRIGQPALEGGIAAMGVKR